MTSNRFFAFLLPVLFLALAPQPALGAKAKPEGVRTLYLIRHGYYDFEDERPADVGKALVPLGVAQARLVADRLRATPVEWTSLHSSTLTRARETAQVIGQQMGFSEIHASALLSECTPPTWREDIMAKETPESLGACTAQLEEAFRKYFVPSPESDRNDIIVAHANVIRYFVTRVLKVDSLAWLKMTVGNCSITQVKIRFDGSMKLLSVGDVGHIPSGLQSQPAVHGLAGPLVVPRN